MSGTSNKQNPIDIITTAAEKKNPGCMAICITNWHLPVFKQSIAYTVASSRKQTPLEEYILKTADLKLSYDIDTSMLPSILGLDEIFIDSTVDSLAEKGLLNTEALPVLRLTDSGEVYLAQKTVPDNERCEEIEYYIDRKAALVYPKLKSDEKIGMHPHYEQIEKQKENAKKYINRKFLLQTANILGKKIESPEDGVRVTSIVSSRITASAKTLYTEICLYDIINDRLRKCIWDYAAKCFRSDIAEFLEESGIDSGYITEFLHTNKVYRRVKSLVSSNEGWNMTICRDTDTTKISDEENAVNIAECSDEEFDQCISSSSTLIVPKFTPARCDGSYILCEKPFLKFSKQSV